MASFPVKRIIPNDVENAFEASQKHNSMKKSKKAKKEKKDKSKTKSVPNIFLHDGCRETAIFTQMRKSKKKKKKTKLQDDAQQVWKSKSKKQLNQPVCTSHTEDSQSVIYISPDLEAIHSTESVCRRSAKEMDKGRSKKKVNFNLPPEQSQRTKARDENFATGNSYRSAISFPRAVFSGNMSIGKQLVGESIVESQPEEMNSQDLFITQKSFLDPYAEFSSSASGNEATTVMAQENRPCRSTTEAATQTENFFTFPELSYSLRFQQQHNTSICMEEPVDLSMPNRARRTPGSVVLAKHSTVDFVKPTKLKISDTSSEDGDVVSKAKGDLSQLKVIQTRLNESFFFKVKGDDSPKPICPLMKLKALKKD
ncbi:uncharacterized protein si:ch211-176l24.4 [Xyrauchen texanus]|uniref:uncharacterized protein si:ch211-176l24.4 n=1 Tax=Xyrauchen texanus TaxID=154827 RepID=UPI00224261DA|nr:uncharacterized protein si:ch211-176l24.4 [Xyrauchen texanus]XP_051979082.1 uncharacterized protein si:ch211-176l24.4 [Xyrauchen texanus]XP_051979083.1 uncharacterized protein si:ch211-176l24.4 [Xyrauchen texanus]